MVEKNRDKNKWQRMNIKANILYNPIKSMATSSKNPIICVTNLAFWIRLGHNSGAFLCLCVSCHMYKLEGLLMLLTSSSPHIHEC